MKRKSLFGALLLLICVFAYFSANAMSTADFDKGMAQGISYAENGLYYEAKDEFQWFADANWGALNSGQQQYLLDYLDGSKAKILQIESQKSASSASYGGGSYSGTSGTQSYIGNKNTKKFHRSSCRTLPSAKNRVSFSSRDEAISQNYSPCKNCKP